MEEKRKANQMKEGTHIPKGNTSEKKTTKTTHKFGLMKGKNSHH